MARNRMFSTSYQQDPLARYFDDAKLAEYLLGEMREEFMDKLMKVPAYEKVVAENDLEGFAELNGVDALNLAEQGQCDILKEVFQQFIHLWPESHGDEEDSDYSPNISDLIALFHSYSVEERKQLWNLMTDDLRKKVGVNTEYDSPGLGQ